MFVLKASIEEIILGVSPTALRLPTALRRSLATAKLVRFATTVASCLLGLHSQRIVLLSLILVHEDLVRARDCLEFLHGLRLITCLVWMILLSHLVVCQLDLLHFGVRLDAQDVVQVIFLVIGHLLAHCRETALLLTFCEKVTIIDLRAATHCN